MTTLTSALEARRDKYWVHPKGSMLSVITVRLPRDKHCQLQRVAADQGVSLNVLCLASLEAALAELETNKPN